jgi:tetratricopeptide (TPR) repeat protein
MAIWIHPKAADNYRGRGLCSARKGEYDKAIADFAQAIRIDPDNFDAHAALAWLQAACPEHEMRNARSAGEHHKAIAAYTDAIRLDPKAEANYYGRGECYARTGEFKQAIADFTDAVRLEREAAYQYVWRASSYAEKGEHGEALIEFTNALQLDPKDADAYIGRAFCYFVTSAHDKAVADLEESRWLKSKAGLDPATADLCVRVIADCTKGLRLDPTDSVAYYNRSWRYVQRGEYEKAIDDFSEALRLDPAVPEEHKPQMMQTVVMMLSNRSQDGPSPIKAPLELVLRCLNKVGVTGNIIGAGYGLDDDEGDEQSDAARGEDG